MTECITIASWMLVVVGVILMILGSIKLTIDFEYPVGSGPLTSVAICALFGGIMITIVYIKPYLQYLPCITIIP